MGVLVVFSQTAQGEESVRDLQEKAILSPYGQALIYIDKALEIEPENAITYRIMASKYLEAGELEQALLAINKDIALAPDDAEAYRWRAVILRKTGNEEGADKDVAKSKKVRKDNFKADLARSKEKRTIRSPKDIKSLRDEIFDLVRNKNYQAAINLFEQYLAIVKKPKNQVLFYTIARAYEETNDLLGAVDIYTKCIEWFPPDANFYERRARLKGKMGDTAGAAMDIAIMDSMAFEKRKERVAQYAKAIEKNPENKGAYVEKARELVEIGELTAALAAIDKAISLPPTKNEKWEEGIVRTRKKIQRMIDNEK